MKTNRRVVGRLVLGCLGVVLGFQVGSAPIGAQPLPRAAPLTIDDLFAEVARRVPSFGGMFIRDEALQVYLLDAAQRPAAEAAIVDVLGGERLSGRSVQARQGQYGFLQLKTWHDRHRLTTLAIPGVVTTGIAESRNRLQIGVKDLSVIPMVEIELARLGVPRQAVDIIETAPFVQLEDSLKTTVRPVLGGIQIQNGGSGTCTMGFTAVRQGQAGFVTNSHCTGTQGVVEGTVFHQSIVLGPGLPLPAGYSLRFGVESADPALFACGSRQCRFADVAFVQRSGSQNPAAHPASADFGYIASEGTNFVIDGKFRIAGEVHIPLEGEVLTKVGRTTGETSGEVIDTCVDINAFKSNGQDTGITNLCQDRVDAASGPGDSGSPVFSWSSVLMPPSGIPSAKLYGILWGGNGESFSFSAFENIESELGALKTAFDQAGANSPPEVKIVKPASNVTVSSGGFNSVEFDASIVDYENCCTDITWTSTVDGVIGTGLPLNYIFSTTGTRTITVTVTDEDGATASDTIVVTVKNDGPTVWIDKPTPGQQLYRNAPYVFEGDSFDMNEPFNRLPCSSLKWTSNIATDPFPVWGCTPQVTFSTVGSRFITVTGTDFSGASDSASVSINVINQPLSGPPIVAILQPAGNNTGFDAYQTVWLRGTANDPDHENPLTYTWKVKIGSTFKTLYTGTMTDGQMINRFWTPSADVPFHCGGSAVRLYLYVKDPDGMTGVAHVDTYIYYPVC